MYIDFIVCKDAQTERKYFYTAPAWSCIKVGEYLLDDRSRLVRAVAIETASEKMLPFMKSIFEIEQNEPVRRINGRFEAMDYSRFDDEWANLKEENESE